MPMDVQQFIHETRFDDLPPQVQKQAELCLLDLIGTGLAGSQTNLSAIMREHATRFFGGTLPLPFDNRTAGPLGLALATGMIIDAVDAHDGYNPAKGHAGCGIFPAALAFALEQSQTDGVEFLTQLVIGYELACRLAVSLHSSVPDYHTSGAWVAVAAAGIGARALGLDADQTNHAMGIAEYHGPRSQMMRVIDHPTMLKDGSGWGAMAGVSAAYLAQSGFTGAPAITVGQGDGWGDLGDRWLIMEQYFKPYPVCRWAQGPVEAILALRESHRLTSTDVAEIHVTTFHESVRLGTKNVISTEQAQYSTSFPCAVAMAQGDVGLDALDASVFDNPEIKRLSAALTMSEDDHCNDHFPIRRFAKVRLGLTNGQSVQSDYVEPKWTALEPPTEKELRGKFETYAGTVLGDKKAKEIQTAVADLTKGGSVNRLVDLLRG